MRAFVLGAGLGTRLRPLTDDRPKPMVPIFGRPLIHFAFDHLSAHGVRSFVVNTHHRPEAYDGFLEAKDGVGSWRSREVHLVHEPVLLDTGGGIRNAMSLLEGGNFWVHNGDIVADLDLHALERRHLEMGNAATLGLRSAGGPLQVGFDPGTGRVLDIRGSLGIAAPVHCLFTGIYLLSPRVFGFLEPRPMSVVTAFLEMIRAGEKVGGVLLDGGTWFDIGTISAYIDLHRLLAAGLCLSYADEAWPAELAPSARIAPDARLCGWNAVGAECRVGAGARLEGCILWDGAEVAPGAELRDCIVRRFAAGSAESTIL